MKLDEFIKNVLLDIDKGLIETELVKNILFILQKKVTE